MDLCQAVTIAAEKNPKCYHQRKIPHGLVSNPIARPAFLAGQTNSDIDLLERKMRAQLMAPSIILGLVVSFTAEVALSGASSTYCSILQHISAKSNVDGGFAGFHNQVSFVSLHFQRRKTFYLTALPPIFLNSEI